MIQHLPNLLTTSRILLIPMALWAASTGWPGMAWATMLFSGLTDFFDGALSRKFGWQSRLGALLDPIADKLFCLCYGVYLAYFEVLPPFYVALVALRGLSQLSAIPILTCWLKIPFLVKPKFFARLATALCFLILILGFGGHLFPPLSKFTDHGFFLGLVGISGLMEVWILVTFLPRFYAIIAGKHDTFE